MRDNTVNMQLACGTMAQADRMLYQYDYGQRLILTGADLPLSYEVHFSNERSGASKTVIGDSTGVDIPDEYLQTGIPVYVWLYLHTGEDDGETVFSGEIRVKHRAKPINASPTPVQQDVITQTIAALNAAVAHSDANVEKYPRIIDGYWYVWDDEQHAFVTTGEKAQGDKGDTGQTGATGATPNLTIGTVTTGAAGSSASVTITGTAENPVLNMSIPKGDPGELTAADIATTQQTQAIINEYGG